MMETSFLLLDELTDEQRMYRDSLRRVMQDLATPEYLRAIDKEGRYPSELYDAWVELGLLPIGCPEQYGGSGGTLADLLMISQELAYWSYDVYTAYSVPLYTAMSLMKVGSHEQKQEIIPALLEGRIKL